MDFNFKNSLKEKPSDDKLLKSARICLESLIKKSKEIGITNFLKEPAKYSLALALVTDNKYMEFSSPKADYKLLIMVAEEVGGEWKIHQFICDLDAKNMQRIENVDKEPIEPKNLGLSTQAEIIFYQRGESHIVSNRVARLEINKGKQLSSHKNILDVYNAITKTSANYHVIVIS